MKLKQLSRHAMCLLLSALGIVTTPILIAANVAFEPQLAGPNVNPKAGYSNSLKNYGAILNYKLHSTEGDLWADGYTYQVTLKLYSENQDQKLQTVSVSDPLTKMEIKSIDLKLDSSNFETANQHCSDKNLGVGLLTYSGTVKLTPNPDGFKVSYELSQLPTLINSQTIGTESVIIVSTSIPNPQMEKGTGIQFTNLPGTIAFCQTNDASISLASVNKSTELELVLPTLTDTNKEQATYTSGFSHKKPFGQSNSKIASNGEILINGLGAGNYLVSLAIGDNESALEKRNTAVLIISIK